MRQSTLRVMRPCKGSDRDHMKALRRMDARRQTRMLEPCAEACRVGSYSETGDLNYIPDSCARRTGVGGGRLRMLARMAAIGQRDRRMGVMYAAIHNRRKEKPRTGHAAHERASKHSIDKLAIGRAARAGRMTPGGICTR